MGKCYSFHRIDLAGRAKEIFGCPEWKKMANGANPKTWET
jgi:hypothetical protein